MPLHFFVGSRESTLYHVNKKKNLNCFSLRIVQLSPNSEKSLFGTRPIYRKMGPIGSGSRGLRFRV